MQFFTRNENKREELIQSRISAALFFSLSILKFAHQLDSKIKVIFIRILMIRIHNKNVNAIKLDENFCLIVCAVGWSRILF